MKKIYKKIYFLSNILISNTRIYFEAIITKYIKSNVTIFINLNNF